MTKTWKRKMVYGLVIGCTTLALGGIAFADSEAPSPGGPMGMPSREHHEKMMKQHMGDELKELVNQGKITQAQAEQVLAFFNLKDQERKADFDKMKNMSPEERHAFIEQHRPQHHDMANDLQANAGLSAEQAQAVAEALRPPMPPEPRDFIKQAGEKLNGLVSLNTITQEQAEQVLTFFKSKDEERQADFEKMKSMTPEERHAFMEQHKPQHHNMANDLQANAGLSEAQAKAVAEALRPPMPPAHHMPHGHGSEGMPFEFGEEPQR